MREIKFRAWDKIDKKMYDNVGLSLIGVKVYKDPDHQPPEEIILDRGRGCFELMQFTGLTDKNGREIYEGDIVKFMNEEPNKMMFYRVEWNEKEARFSVVIEHIEYGKYFGKIDEILENLEVIGNIYENPDLTKP